MTIPTWLLITLEIVALVVHTAGILLAIHAVMNVRTSQGAIAWAIPLAMFPWLAVPAYLVLGRSKFQGYVDSRRAGDLHINHIAITLWQQMMRFHAQVTPDDEQHRKVLESLAKIPTTGGNKATLLIDGQATFDAMFAAMEKAERYILVQFFIVHDDEIGRELQQRLVRKARAGVKIHFLYDEIGSHDLPSSYLAALREAGIEAVPFNSTRGRGNRFQLNFRNHRKITVVDGKVAFVGGHNAGDEYLGKSKRFGPWRDTHIELEGPSVQGVQLTFLEDWYWATGHVPELEWKPVASDGDQKVLVLPSGPADSLDTCDLFFTYTIHAAKKRLWITSPYFVPDDSIVDALQLAALRGVDVRILLPNKPDHVLVYLSAFSYLDEMEKAGVKVYRYQPGFMHQKAMLVDDAVGVVGTANLDNRSFRLNFELTILVADREFAKQTEAMLARDFAQSHELGAADLRTRSLAFRVAVRVARLLSPVQ